MDASLVEAISDLHRLQYTGKSGRDIVRCNDIGCY